MDNIVTDNLADFGARERAEAAKLLSCDLPDNFSTNGVKVMFNRNSGYVFLTNEEFEVAMIGGDDKLHMFYSTPYEGHEGFIGDLLEEHEPDDLHDEDVEYIRAIAEQEGADLPEAWELEE